jgi:hypothetical protein
LSFDRLLLDLLACARQVKRFQIINGLSRISSSPRCAASMWERSSVRTSRLDPPPQVRQSHAVGYGVRRL